MPETPRLRFRPHHFLCALGYEGKGYSDAFTANMTSIVADGLRTEDGQFTEIEVTHRTDAICAPCPKRRGAFCTAEPKIRALDNRHARALSLRAGDVLTWAEAQVRIKERIKPETLDDICKGCRWLPMGMCKSAVARLRDG
jgi:hypothetical protein